MISLYKDTIRQRCKQPIWFFIYTHAQFAYRPKTSEENRNVVLFCYADNINLNMIKKPKKFLYKTFGIENCEVKVLLKKQSRVQRFFDTGIPVWAPKLTTKKDLSEVKKKF